MHVPTPPLAAQGVARTIIQSFSINLLLSPTRYYPFPTVTDTPKSLPQPRGELTLRTLAMPADANPAGDIFGGWVMSQMDIGSALCAVDRAQSRVVTAAVDGMSFIAPVYIGDVLCVYAEVVKTGRTSLHVHVEAWVLRNRQGERVQVTQGIFIFVALDDEGKPRELPAS